MLRLILSRVSFWLSLAGVTLALALLARFVRPEPHPAPAVQSAVKQEPSSIAAAGIVEALEQVDVSTSVAGVVSQIPVVVGDRVEEGDPLLHLDSRLAVAEAKAGAANLAVTEAELARLRESLNRLESVSDPRAVSREEIETQRSEVAIAEAKVKAASASVDQATVSLNLLTVRSPLKGSVLQVNVHGGEFAVPGATPPPLVVGDISALQVRADVDEEPVSRLPEKPTAVAYLKGRPDKPIPLEFIRTEPLVVPKVSLTGASTERVDTRVLQIIFRIVDNLETIPIYIGQQVDVFIDG